MNPGDGDDWPGSGEGIESARITIVKFFNDDIEGGGQVFTSYSPGLTLVDALGMLTFSQMTTFTTYMNEDES